MPVPPLPQLKRQRIFHVEYFMRRLQKEYPCMLLRVNIPDLNLCIRVRVRERECVYIYTHIYVCIHVTHSALESPSEDTAANSPRVMLKD